jgi:hypothetical protein
MPYDMAISDHGDLILTAHRDIAGITGVALIEQRMKLRLRLNRGSWIYDATQTLGSQLYTLVGSPSGDAVSYVDAHVREALRDMEEISVEEVQVAQTEKDITLLVVYHQELTDDDTQIPTDTELQELSVTVPLVAANE